MKFGARKPNLKKSFKARTTGALKRKIKKATNPLYGKKGMGLIKNPKKAIYNKVYHSTTVGVNPLSNSNRKSNSNNNEQYRHNDFTQNNEMPAIKKERKPIVWKKWHAYAFVVLSLGAIVYYIKNGTSVIMSLLSGLVGGAIFTYLLARFTNE